MTNTLELELHNRQQAWALIQVKFFDRWGGYSISLVDGPEAALRAYRVLIA